MVLQAQADGKFDKICFNLENFGILSATVCCLLIKSNTREEDMWTTPSFHNLPLLNQRVFPGVQGLHHSQYSCYSVCMKETVT